MQKAQTISSFYHSVKGNDQGASTITKVMIPVLDENQRLEIEAVSDLIKAR
jgi:isoleucyl-tRNA synthetase